MNGIAEAVTRTGGAAVAILWDLQTFSISVKTYVAAQRALRRGWDPVVILIAMWSRRAPRVVNVYGATSRIITMVPHSILVGCTSSTSIARAVLPSRSELGAVPVPTHMKTGTAYYRHVGDIFQITWAQSESDATIGAIKNLEGTLKL